MGRVDRRGADFSAAVLEALPAAAFVIDEGGTILFATRRAAEAVGIDPGEAAGTSVLSFVSADTAWVYASAVAMATDYPDVTMGPLRIELVRTDGRRRAADLWATNRLADPAIGGVVCLLTEETTALGLVDAVASLADDDPLRPVADRVVHAMEGHPVVADAAVVVPAVDDGEPFSRVGDSSLAPNVLAAASPAARLALATARRQMHEDLSDLSAVARDIAVDAGYAALWVEPVVARDDGRADAALVLWRRRPGNPSPNQLSSIHQGASILALALRQARLDALGRR